MDIDEGEGGIEATCLILYIHSWTIPISLPNIFQEYFKIRVGGYLEGVGVGVGTS